MSVPPELCEINGTPDIDTVYLDIVHKLLPILQAKRCIKPWGCDMLMCAYKETGECRWPQERARLLQPSPATRESSIRGPPTHSPSLASGPSAFHASGRKLYHAKNIACIAA